MASASENPFKGILTSLPKPGGGEFGKFYSLPALNDPRIGISLMIPILSNFSRRFFLFEPITITLWDLPCCTCVLWSDRFFWLFRKCHLPLSKTFFRIKNIVAIFLTFHDLVNFTLHIIIDLDRVLLPMSIVTHFYIIFWVCPGKRICVARMVLLWCNRNAHICF